MEKQTFLSVVQHAIIGKKITLNRVFFKDSNVAPTVVNTPFDDIEDSMYLPVSKIEVVDVEILDVNIIPDLDVPSAYSTNVILSVRNGAYDEDITFDLFKDVLLIKD